MNKQSNTYTIIYIVVVVLVVGSLLALTAMSLKDRQTDNANADKMLQILKSVRVPVEDNNVIESFNSHITEMLIVDAEGNTVKKAEGFDAEIFNIDVAKQSKLAASERQLPVFICQTDDAGTKYILPMSGAGLWGPIWGYISVDTNGSTIYGAYFSHQGETPGLGAEIENQPFQKRFNGLNLLKDGNFYPIEIIKTEADSLKNQVQGVSGGTITSKGVGEMVDNCLAPYTKYLDSLARQSSNSNKQ